MISFLNLIRWQNILLIILVQILIKFALFNAFEVTTALSYINFGLLVLSSCFIAAAGNIINDIYDVDIDKINKPEKVIVGNLISEKRVFTLFIIFNVIGVGLGFFISSQIGKPEFAALFVIISALLYIYSSYLKQFILIGNLLISVLVSMSILIIGIFDLIPVLSMKDRLIQGLFFDIIKDYALLAFILTLIREIVKDIIDIDGDFNQGMKTLPIVIGRYRSGKIVFVLTLVPLFLVTYYIINYLYKMPIAVVYFIVLILAPLLFVCIKSFDAESKKDYLFISNLLKITMFFGALSLLLYPLILQ